MKPQEKLSLIGDAYVSQKVGDERESIKVRSEKIPKEMQNALQDIQFKLNDETGTFELDYEIMDDACSFLSSFTLKEIESDDIMESAHEDSHASVYTATRLSYLNINNQAEVSEKIGEYGGDIADACAYWYDEKVVLAIELVREYILAK